MRRVHGHVFPGESMGRDLDFITVRTTQDIRPTGLSADLASGPEGHKFPMTGSDGTIYADGDDYMAAREAQRRFDAIVNVISLRAQPVVIGNVTVEEDVTLPVPDLPGAGGSGDPDGTVYNVKFVVEHAYVWSAEDLAISMDGIQGLSYSLGDTSENNIAVYVDNFHSSAQTYFVS